MATVSYKVLGQSIPAATTVTTLYTAPASTQAVCSTIAVCNQGVSTTVRIAIRPAGAALANQHYIVYEQTINQYDSLMLSLGVTLAATDVISVYSGTATVSFGLFGSELV